MKGNGTKWVVIILAVMALLISNSLAYCSICAKLKEDPWPNSAQSFLSDNSTVQTPSDQVTIQQAVASNPNPKRVDPQRSSSFQQVLAPVTSFVPIGASSTNLSPFGYDVILDVSPEATEFIQGAISIPYAEFMNNGSLKPVSEVAKILGDAGISERDSVLVYGQCLPCGVNSAYVYWVLKYLGHDNVKILDGGIDDWVAAKLPTETVPKILPKTTYTPKLNPGLLATYDYVKNSKVQIVDARSFQEFGLGYIPKALNIPYDQVMDNGQLKGEADLRDLFSSLDKMKPVVVYSDTGAQAGSVWFALEALGYNASLYSWQDWTANQPRLNVVLEDIHADPNPATQGSPVKITALFGETKKITNTSSTSTGTSTNKTILTIKGCATCGFGSPQGFANINKSSGVAQLGNSGQMTAPTQAGSFICSAIVKDSAGSNVGQVSMKQIAGDEYSGIWNANVGPGSYKATIVVSASGITKVFDNALEIKIVGTEKDTSKYKKVGN
jgi:thiosulfate/3-mercaptopyruvate sulfurtransferase